MRTVRTRLFSILLTCAMLLSLLPITALAADAWDGTADTTWYNDSTNEFTITTAKQLAGLAKLVNEGPDGGSPVSFQGKTIKLSADIDLGGKEWTPIGWYKDKNSAAPFEGTFDGSEHTISNLYINKPNSTHQGLFGYIKGTGYTNYLVTDLNLTNVNVTGFNYTGGLSGQAYTCGFKNVTVSGNVIGGRYVGGLVGHVYTQFEGCNFVGSVTGEYGLRDQIGGIAGSGDGRFYNCTAIQGADSEYLVSGDCWNGGIIGGGQEGASAIDCYVKGNIMNKSEWYGCSGAGIAGEAGMYADCKFTGNYFDGVVYCSDKVVNAPIIGLVNTESETVLTGMTVGGNSWNTEIYPPDLKVAVAAMENKSFEEITVSATRKEPRNANLVGSLADLEYMEAGNLTIVGTEVTSDALKDFADNSNGAFKVTIDESGAITIQKVVAKIGETEYATLAAAINAANTTGGESNVTVTITKSGEYDPFTITRANVTVQAAEGVKATINVSKDKTGNINGESVTLKGLNFASSDGTTIFSGGTCDNLKLDNCTFTGNGTGTALYIHQPNITIQNCTFEDFERGYYTCGDNHAAGKMTFTDNTFTNVRVPIDGYWGKKATDATDIQITGNTFDNGNWDAAYIQLWDYAQYLKWEGNTDRQGSAIDATIMNNTYNGDVVIYATHFNWFYNSTLTVDEASKALLKYRVLVELENAASATVTNADGSAITAFNETTTSQTSNGKTFIYSICEGDYIFNIKPENATEAVLSQEVEVKQPESVDPTGDNTNKVTVPAETVNVAQVGNEKYTTLAEAINAAKTGGNKTVDLLSNVKIDSWDMIWNLSGITINGNNKTIKINAIESGQNHDAVFHSAGNNTFKDLTIDLSGIAADSQAQGYRAFSAAPGDSFTNVTVIGNEHVSYGITVGGTESGENETITIDGCSFSNCRYGVYSDLVTNLEKLAITSSTFTNCDYASILYTENVTFTGNTVSGGKLNIMSDKQTVTGNTFTDSSRIKFYNQPAAFEKNKISADSYLDADTGVTGIDVSENYWGGGAPSADQLNGVKVTGSNVYYEKPTMKDEDLNTYVPPHTGGGSGSSSTTYQVSVDKAEGGKITVSPTRAEKGETVTITVKPDEGYELGKLTVTDKDGDKITLTQKDDNKYTFKMPAGKVTVKATFTEIEVEPEQPELPFSDVAEQDWFYDAVVYVYENELMNGTSATAFSPSVTTSRAMMLTMLARYDGVDTSTGSTWYEAGAAWAVAEGVSDGTNLEADLTREQLVTMLWRYAGSPMVEKDLPDYPDRDEVSDWAVRAMVWAVDNGIITGNGAGELNPQGSASRAEVATILMRFIQL